MDWCGGERKEVARFSVLKEVMGPCLTLHIS